jgi:hypothetical protein
MLVHTVVHFPKYAAQQRVNRLRRDPRKVEQDAFQRGVAPAQQQLKQETDDANHKTGDWPDHRHLELYARTRWLPLNIGDATKDEQGDTFHGQTTSACNQRVGQFMQEHGDKQQQGREKGYEPIGGS